MEQALITSRQLASIVAARRRARGVTQTEIAHSLALSQSRYSELEQDPATLTLDRLLTLVNMLGLELVLRDAGSSSPDNASAPQW